MENTMKTPMGENSEFREFFLDQLKEVYWAEDALQKALKEMAGAATSKELAAAFEKHAQDSVWQIASVEKIFELLGEKPDTKKCKGMDGLIEEAQKVIKATDKDSYTRDAGLILAGQQVEHFEIATYGTLRVLAGDMGQGAVRQELEKVLANEKETDEILTKVAETYVNERAVKE